MGNLGRRADQSLTSINIILDRLLQGALDRLLKGLALEHGADVSRAAGVHGALEGIALPAKHVITVLRVAVPANCGLVMRPNLPLNTSLIGVYTREETYLSLVLHTKGCEPSSGHKSGSEKGVVCGGGSNRRGSQDGSGKIITSQMVSSMTCGTLTGWVEGQTPPSGAESWVPEVG